MSEHELSAALSLTRTAGRVARRLESERRLARQQLAWRRRRRRNVKQCKAIDAEIAAGQEPTGKMPF
jgi:hypothetical protein